MTIDQLKQIIEISNTGSINQAASNLYMSQPNLSQSVKNLELELGVTLVNRTRRGVTLTEKGKAFVNRAKGIIAQMDRLQLIGSYVGAEPAPTLSIASEQFRIIQLITSYFHNSAEGQNIRIIFHEYDKNDAITAIENGISDIGFISIISVYEDAVMRNLKSKGLVFTPLSTGIPIAVVGKMNPLYNLGEMATAEPSAFTPFVQVKSPGTDFGGYNDKGNLLGIKEEKNSAVFESNSARYSFVENTDSYLLTTHHAKFYEKHPYRPNLRKLQIAGASYHFIFGWIKKENAVLSPQAEAFIETVKKHVQ